MRMTFKLLTACFLGSALTCLGAASDCPNWPEETGLTGSDGPIVRGEWNSNFRAGKAYAEEHHIPLVLFWANHGCHFCEDVERNVQDESFVTWRKTRRYVMVYSYGMCDEDKQAAYAFANWGPYPIVRVYWVTKDGATHSEAFTARKDKKVGMEAQPFADKVDEILKGFGYNFNTCDTYFPVGGTECDRLEAQVGSTEYVDVPLSRFIDDVARTDKLEYAQGSVVGTSNIVWRIGEFDTSVRIPVDSKTAKAGDLVRLTIRNADGDEVLTSAITFVDRKDSPDNPLWKTERDEETLDYGEWTCDIDTATNKVAALKAKGTEAWTLVYSHGSQWCPYCYLNGPSFVETETFRQWAKDNNVVLVSADMPHNSDSNPDQDWCTIWHRKSEETNLYFDGKGKVARSGAGYLSRKMISDDEALAMRRQLKELGTSFLHLPEDYQAARAIIPGLTLIDAAGKVVGRLETFDYNMNNHTDGAFAPQYCRRLSEMIQSAKESPDRASENLNDNCETTPLALTPGGAAAKGSISHADYRDVYRLNNVTPGIQVQLKVKGERNDAVRLCLLKGDAAGKISEMIKTVTGNLAAGVEIDTAQIPGFGFDPAGGTYFVRVSCHDIMPTTSSNYRPYRLRWGDNEEDATFDGYKAGYDGSTLTAYEVSVTPLFVPVEVLSSYTAAVDETMTFSVVAGSTYKFVGVNPPAGQFTDQGANLYLAKETCCVEMTPADPSRKVDYQLWRPGEISIVEGDRRLMERDGGGVFTVTRANGSSDACAVTLRVRPGSEQNVAGRYELRETVLNWASGETGSKVVAFSLIDNGQYDDEGSFVVELVKGASCSATVSGVGAKVTILDTTSPIFDKSRYDITVYEGFACADEFGLRNVSEKGSVKLTVSKSSDKLPSGLKLAYDRKTGVVELTGIPKAKSAGTYATECTVTQNRDTGYPTTFAVTVKDPRQFNSFVGIKRDSQVIPMTRVENGLRQVVGTLTVSISTKNKITAKYAGLDVSSVSFSGLWSTVDEEAGTLGTVMEKKGRVLTLTMDREGRLEACVDGAVSGTIGLEQKGIFGAWAGYYAVALPCQEGEDGSFPCGSGYLSLTMTSSSAVTKGQVKFSGKMPSGQSVSGTAYLIPNGSTMLLPIYKASSKYAIGVMLELYPNGAANWNNPENVQVREVVNLAEGHGAFCQQVDRGVTRRTLHDAAGSWYPTTVTPGQLAKEFYGDGAQVFQLSVLDGDRRVVVANVVASGRKLVLTEKISGVTISFTAKSGLFKGKAKFVDADGMELKGSYTGILVPGWHKSCDCGDAGIEFPFGSGSLVVKRNVGGVQQKVALPVVLDVPKVD